MSVIVIPNGDIHVKGTAWHVIVIQKMDSQQEAAARDARVVLLGRNRMNRHANNARLGSINPLVY